ncbi:unnamed protein product, partial [Scytosiphon promiscuus]
MLHVGMTAAASLRPDQGGQQPTPESSKRALHEQERHDQQPLPPPSPPRAGTAEALPPYENGDGVVVEEKNKRGDGAITAPVIEPRLEIDTAGAIATTTDPFVSAPAAVATAATAVADKRPAGGEKRSAAPEAGTGIIGGNVGGPQAYQSQAAAGLARARAAAAEREKVAGSRRPLEELSTGDG